MFFKCSSYTEGTGAIVKVKAMLEYLPPLISWLEIAGGSN